MCIKRKIEEATYGSTVEYQGRLWVILSAQLEGDLETVGVSLRESQEVLTVPFGTEVVSHTLNPIERRKFGNPKCELPVIEVERK